MLPCVTQQAKPTHKPHPKSKFTPEEDAKLRELVSVHGDVDWAKISTEMGTRSPRQCRERWITYLSPSVIVGNFTDEEDTLLINLQRDFGSHWKRIAMWFPNRTDVSLRNRWAVLKRREAKENRKKITVVHTPISATYDRQDETVVDDFMYTYHIEDDLGIQVGSIGEDQSSVYSW